MRSGKVTYRFIVLIITFVFSVIFSIPSFLQIDKMPKINLGLDLQGGLHMLLNVDLDEAISSKIKSVASSLSYSAGKEDLLYSDLKIESNYFEFEVLDKDEMNKFDAILNKITGLNIQKNGQIYNVSLTENEVISTKEYAIDQAVETIRNRIDQFGLSEPTVARQGKEDILVEIPGVKSNEDKQRAKDLIATSAHLQLMALDDKRQDRAHLLTKAQAASFGDIILNDAKNPEQKYVVKQLPVLDGSMLVDARVGFDQANQPVINFTLNSEGAAIFGDFTGSNVGKRLAIVLDDKVYSAPRINERIGGGSGQISGGFTMEEARDVAIALRSGALLAPVTMGEERTIGPSLGADSIKQSSFALALASVLIVELF